MKTILLLCLLSLFALPARSQQTADFQFCLQDNGDPTTYVLLNGNTGDFAYYCSGVINASGKGVVTHKGTSNTLQQIKGARVVRLEWDTSGNGSGTAYVSHSGVLTCQIADSNIAGNTCNP